MFRYPYHISLRVLISNLISCPTFSKWREKMCTSLYLVMFHVLQVILGCSFIVYKWYSFQHFLMGCVSCICYSCAPLNSSWFTCILFKSAVSRQSRFFQMRLLPEKKIPWKQITSSITCNMLINIVNWSSRTWRTVPFTVQYSHML